MSNERAVTKKSEDFSKWYTDVIIRCELADYGPVKGTMVIRPYGYAIWENIQKIADRMFKETGHVNAYFPMFIPESFMKKEAEHVEGFAPECAVITHGGGKELEEPLYVRPTSETIIWAMYKKWIKSYRDLPLLINQWANVVRWEMRTRLFLRTTEFLWQEGHTAHATFEEAEEEARRMIEIYRKLLEDYLAIPVIVGKKTENEKFAGAVHTYTVEAMTGDKKALQAGTSHNLGQNFAKAFDVKFLNENNELEYVYATSWGISTRLIGAVIMVHGDDKGLVIPPEVAPYQVVIVPIWKKDTDKQAVTDFINEKLISRLKEAGIRYYFDNNEQVTPGWKFNEWEMRGVPLRIEVGPREVTNNTVVLVRRDEAGKEQASIDNIIEIVKEKLIQIQKNLFYNALKFREENTYNITSYEELKEIMEKGGFAKAFWAGSSEDEKRIQEETKATIRCVPFNQSGKGKCIFTGKETSTQVIFARAY